MEREGKIYPILPQIKREEVYEPFGYVPHQGYQHRPQFNNSLYNFGISTQPYFGYSHSPYYHPFQNSYPLPTSYWGSPSKNLLPSQESTPFQVPTDIIENKVIVEEDPQIKCEQEEESQYYQGSEQLAIPRKRKNKRQKQTRRSSSTYYWSVQENYRYHQFLKANQGIFDLSLNQKKAIRVNVMMSKKVKTRNAQQCHSHHQKMMKKYGSLASIIENMTVGGVRQGDLSGIKIEHRGEKDQVNGLKPGQHS